MSEEEDLKRFKAEAMDLLQNFEERKLTDTQFCIVCMALGWMHSYLSDKYDLDLSKVTSDELIVAAEKYFVKEEHQSHGSH